MDERQEIEEIQSAILSEKGDRYALVDRLIKMQGNEAMGFFQSIFLIDPSFKKQGTSELHDVAGYGVRKLLELRAIDAKSDFKYCPGCGHPLKEHEIMDPYMTGLRCKNDHCFHIEIKHGEPKNKDIKAEKSRTLEIAIEWLTNKILRKELPNQIAEILRKFVEMKDEPMAKRQKKIPPKYCPVCRQELLEFDQDDVWVVGLKCSNDHVFYSRSGLNYNNVQLSPDLDLTTYKFLVESYLNRKEEYLPKQIMKLLADIKEDG